MSLDNIIQSLEKDTAKEIKKIKDEFSGKESELKAEHKLRVERTREEILVKAKREAQKNAEMKLFARKSKLRQELLRSKREIIDQVYAKALEKLENKPEGEKKKLVEKLSKELPSGGKTVPAKDSGGFIWQSDKMTIDNSWPELISQLKEQTEAEVASKLFSN
jgi:vacuolar-type H+-ATPase subunit E/Vma4